jgi:hypothetical protein
VNLAESLVHTGELATVETHLARAAELAARAGDDAQRGRALDILGKRLAPRPRTRPACSTRAPPPWRRSRGRWRRETPSCCTPCSRMTPSRSC